MRISELTGKNVIYLSNIRDGFDQYNHKIYTLSYEQAADALRAEQQKDVSAGVYTDFYYFALERDAKNRVEEVLTIEEKKYLNTLRPQKDKNEEELVFLLSEELLNIVVKLNEKEVLFSTIYFEESNKEADGSVLRKRSTWWGNYNCQYVVFTDGSEEQPK